jgi:signal transduction histidine kinase
MENNTQVQNRQDWTLIGLRLLFLAFAGLALFTSRSATGETLYANNEVIIVLVVSAVSVMFIAIVALIPPIETWLPFVVMVADFVTMGVFTYVCRADALFLMAGGGLLILGSGLRLGAIWGSVQAVAVLVAIIVGYAAAFGPGQTTTFFQQNGLMLISLFLFGVCVNVWGGVLNGALESRDKQLRQIRSSRMAQLKDMRGRTRAIYEMAATLSSTLHHEKIVNSAMNAGWLGMNRVRANSQDRLVSMVMLFDHNDGKLHVVTSRGLTRKDEDFITPGISGMVGEALKQCIPIFGGSVRQDPELGTVVAFQGLRSVMCIPLRAGFDNYGVMVYGSESANAFTDEHTELLTAIGTQATVALQNAVLYQNLLSDRDRIVQVEEEARKKLARDLHDGPTQKVAAIAMHMGILQKMFERTPDKVPEELKKVEDMARQTTKEIRHMLFTQRPLVLETQGLNAALNQFAEKMKETYDQNVVVRVGVDAEKVLETHQQGVIFYIIEEAVGNARKHAQASVINVSVQRHENMVLVGIADNGVGFDVSAVSNNYERRGSLGMVNLHERTDVLGGKLTIDSAVGKGTTITVAVPLKEEMLKTATVLTRKAAETAANTKLATSTINRMRDVYGGE